jgi:hypothetical protein
MLIEYTALNDAFVIPFEPLFTFNSKWQLVQVGPLQVSTLFII